ncbi:hypothetical protein ABW19_dt0202535 [Dactylella cylindrospora]|nr:hypothetical protein ABW19_dt0202535 [Dactylella cylindrospora]
MSLINASHDSLPYIDRPLTPTTTSRVNALINAELDPSHATAPHPSLPHLPPPVFTDLIIAELDRVSKGLPFSGGVDASRYEPQSAPSSLSDKYTDDANADADADGNGKTTSTQDAAADEWHNALRQAYTTCTHLSNRVTNLTLLSSFGQNSWLIGNSQMEGVLAQLERELVALKEETELTNRERKRKQVDVQEELERLERRWKDGVGKVLEIEVASEMVFRETLERRRLGQS